MTAAGVHRPPPGAAPAAAPARPAIAAVRLGWLYLVSRRAPAALGLPAALGCLLWAALHWRWNIAGGAAAQQLVPLTIESGAAAVIAVSTYGPFGEPERATGRWLPWLRLGAVLVLTAAGFAMLAAGVHPVIPLQGSVGASGDPAPRCACRRRRVHHQGPDVLPAHDPRPCDALHGPGSTPSWDT